MGKLPMGVKVREEPLFADMLIIIGIFGLLSVILRSIIWEYLLEMAMLPGLFASALAYVWRALRQSSTAAADAKKAFNAQVAGEAYKFAVTLLLFALVFKSYAQLAALPLFLAYVATVVVYWMAMLRQQ